MPYKHLKNVLEHHKNAPEDAQYNHVKFYDLHQKPSANEKDHLVSAIVELKAGEPVTATYPGPTVGYLIEGEAEGEDSSKPGEIIKVETGDVLHIDKDTSITWKTSGGAKVIGVTYVPAAVIQSASDLIVRN